jgi:hypothetical protein
MQNLYQLAQEITDKVLGSGTYKRLNHFDPSKGETHSKALATSKLRRKSRTRRKK